jgi:pyrroline-5-carboxylate reductase
MNKKILFIGCGKMGSIILNNLISNKIANNDDIVVLKPSPNNKINEIKYINSINNLDKNYQADIVFICIKPQNAFKNLIKINEFKFYHENTIFISIIAGIETDFFKNIYQENAKIVRTMPNIAIEIAQGIMPFYAVNLKQNDKDFMHKIFKNFGIVFEVFDENLFHILTAIYGCGPAYVFLMQELFEKIAIENGIEKNLSHQLTQNLFLSSALIASKSSSFEEIRNNVTSKKGVTQYSLNNLIKNNKQKKLLDKSIKMGIKKSQKIAKLSKINNK